MPLRTPKPGRDFLLGLSTLWRRRWIPLSWLCAGAALGLAVLLWSVPLYRANAIVMLGGGLEGNIAAEIVQLESATTLGQVTRKLNLYQDPHFARPRLIDRLSVYGQSELALQERIFYRLRRGIHVEAKEGAIIEISGRFPNPEMTARIINATVEAWRQQKLDEKRESAEQVTKWMGVRLEDIKDGALTSQRRLQEFQTRHNPAYMQKLQSDVTETQKQIADLSSRLATGPQDIDTLSTDLDAARKKLEDLETQVKNINSENEHTGDMERHARLLELSAEGGQHVYEQFELQYQKVMADYAINLSDVRVISFATIPSTPDVCGRLMQLLWLALGGFGLGLLQAGIGIICPRGFASAQQLEAMTGYPVFASIPAAAGKEAVHHRVLQDPAAILAESLRTLRIALRLRGEVGRKPRTVAFTSTLPDEGKTSLSVMLATIAAKSGERVCIVDCDLRRPSLHKAFGIGNAKGLADYLSGRLSLDEVIHRRDPSGVHLITGKSVPSYSLTLLTSGRMERLIGSLREQYDLIILDAPSSLAFADSRVLAGMVDQTLYVVDWMRTPRRSVLASLKNYADLGYEPLALVMNKVDLGEYVRDSAAAVVYRYGHEADPAFAA